MKNRMNQRTNAYRFRLRSSYGFSLMEIMIALTLMAIGVALVGGRVLDSFEEGKVNSAKSQIGQFKAMMEDYRRYCSMYPTTEQGLDALIAKPTTPPECKSYPASGIMNAAKVPADPWDNPYDYQSDGKTYVITSYGRGKVPEGEGFDKDIKSTDL